MNRRKLKQALAIQEYNNKILKNRVAGASTLYTRWDQVKAVSKDINIIDSKDVKRLNADSLVKAYLQTCNLQQMNTYTFRASSVAFIKKLADITEHALKEKEKACRHHTTKPV